MSVAELQTQLQAAERELSALRERADPAEVLAQVWATLQAKIAVLRERLARAMDAERRERERAQAEAAKAAREQLIADLGACKVDLEARWARLAGELGEIDERMAFLAREFTALTNGQEALTLDARAQGIELGPVDNGRAAALCARLQRGSWVAWEYWRRWGRA